MYDLQVVNQEPDRDDAERYAGSKQPGPHVLICPNPLPASRSSDFTI